VLILAILRGLRRFRRICAYFKGSDCEKFKLNTRPNFTQLEAYLKPTEVNYKLAYENVLKSVGAFPRDDITNVTVEETIQRTGEWGARIPSNLMTGLQPSLPTQDSDNDGMPDVWESQNGLNPNDKEDQHKIISSGYSAIEQYINELADELVN